MLNYDILTNDHSLEERAELVRSEITLSNPFPGLRPFTVDENHLFFGRESHVDEVLVKLSKNRFITIMGYSGSGKSSLLYCGVIPIVYGGFMTNSGPNWNIITTRPGSTPLRNLSKSILSLSNNEDIVVAKEDTEAKRRVISSVLRSNASGLVDIVSRYHQKSGDNTLIFIDQFEELFRFANSSVEASEEARIYVNHILDACQNSTTPIYIAITMRSDYVGECAKFPGLTQLVNQSNYLVPMMSREQKRMAIEGPIAVGGGRISKRLLKRLLNDIGDNQDQLPILQHALMRTWDFWKENREENEPIDIGHYNAIGKITEALSQHANETYDELSTREKEIAEILFKSLTEKTSSNYGMRRPVRLGLVAELAEASEAEVIAVVDRFRQTGRSFLMPPDGVELDGNSIIEISHESLMRIWTRLKAWVDEEYESAQMYRRLSEAAAMYQIGRTGLWRPPDLQLALNWQKKQRPTRAWAKRYDETFERAIVFLDTSRITYEAEQRNQEMLQKRLLKRTKAVAIFLGAATVVSILFFLYAITQSLEASKQAEAALAQQEIAEREREEARKQTQIAEDERKIAQDLLREVEKAKEEAERSYRQALAQTKIAEDNVIIAQQQREIASGEQQKALAEQRKAEIATAEAKTNFELANKLLYQTIAQSMAVKSIDIEDADLKGLLAYQAKVFYDQYDGRKYDPYIYNGLYTATAQIKGSNYNTVPALHRNAVRSIVINKAGTQYYSTGTEGKIMSSSLSNTSEHVALFSNKFPNRAIDVDDQDQWLVNASDSSYIQIYNLAAKTQRKIYGHQGYVNDVAFITNTTDFISVGSDMTIRKTSAVSGEMNILFNSSSEIKTMAISKNGFNLIGGTTDGNVYLYNINTKREDLIYSSNGIPVHAVAFSPDNKKMAFGLENGEIKILDVSTKAILAELSGQKGRISALAFSPDSKLFASGSFDKSIYMWAVNELDELPIKMTDNDAYVWDIEFTKDSQYIIAGCGDGDIRLWPTNPDLLSQTMCNELKRNMSEEEWKTYVGNDIAYRNTCINLLLNDY